MVSPLIELTGVDGSGKTTIAQGLQNELGGHYLYSPPEDFREERERIRYASKEEQLEFYLKINCVLSERIRELLETGHVFVEPFQLSTQAYHSVNLERVIEIPDQVIQPDRIIYLHAVWEVIERRLSEREVRQPHEKIDYLQQVAAKYDQLLDGKDNVITVDTSNTTAEENVGFLIKELGL